jgi:RNA polymerase sigma-70 factor (ECF subfamily)
MNNRSQHPSFAISEEDLPYLDKLPANFAKPIKLLHFEKMNYIEIATDLGIPLGTVKSRIHRGRAMIRQDRAITAAANETFQEATL